MTDKLRATIEFDPPDHKMYLAMEGATVEEGEWAGTKIGTLANGVTLHLIVKRDGQSLGTVIVPATTWAGAILQAIRDHEAVLDEIAQDDG